ncbi:hypothetical protein GCM10022225_77920 [Plantactinospora mayteni]|uniref:HMA domain-containing protein n=2 Tax=Plantactinospora mayteni TaxID=566021 RepID=A0ABQ4ERH5_9ACTN|nr:hypothetical protein Pma05_38060 [Plantactinospora mayteni]
MCTSCETAAAQAVPTTGEGREFVVAGMSCQPCSTKVATAVRAVPGVTDVRVELSERRVTVAGTAEESQIHAAIVGAGYTITNP